MPKTTFSTDNVRQSATSFPKLKLNHDQTMRVVCIEEGPTFEWCHSVNKPRVSAVTNKAIMVTKKRKSGEEYQDYDMEFVGNPICHGDPDVLEEKGVDPSKCPLCAASVSDEAFKGPQRRFAIHVLRYATKQGTPNISEPFSVETLVWCLSDGKFASLAGIFVEHAPADGGAPDPRAIDLILGPCTNAGFQNYEIKAGARCEMRASQERMQRAITTYRENHASDLTPYCGRVTERRWVEQMIEDVQDRFALIRSGGGTPAVPDVSDTLDSSLLDTASTGTKKEFVPVAAEGEPGTGDALNEFKPGGSVQETLPESTAVEEPSKAAPVGDAPSFEELLGMLPSAGSK